MIYSAIYRAHTNIALIKYWGKRNEDLFLPVTSSLSLTLEAFYTDTEVVFSEEFTQDTFYLNGKLQDKEETAKVSRFVNFFRDLADCSLYVRVRSVNHVPTAAGLASSASAYAALASACNVALNLNLSPTELSTYARQGSGSATRSLFGGFTLWHKGKGDISETSYAEKVDDADWDIAMLALVVNDQEKAISSREGMKHTLETSPFYALWAEEVAQDLEQMLTAIHRQDINAVGEIAEHNAMKMHATMLAANPSFNYFEADTLKAVRAVHALRQAGYSAYYTMDAGPNVKIICKASELEAIQDILAKDFSNQQMVASIPGPAPHAITKEEFEENVHANKD